jgi:putative oxidoreductase
MSAVRARAYGFVIERFAGSRSALLPLFQQADDSPDEIGSYLEAGEVLVARRGEQIVGHVQAMALGETWELKSVAVIESERGCGIGTALICAALNAAWSSGVGRVLIATATADIDNLRFYQRLGFRIDRVERDAFSIERGYGPREVDGIPLRDRAWLSIEPPRNRKVMKDNNSLQFPALAEAASSPADRCTSPDFVAENRRAGIRDFARWSPVPLRMIVGYGFLMHGYAKLARGPHLFASTLQGLGYSAPEFLSWATILIEVLGGCSILFGAFVRLASVPLAATMIVAMLTVHLQFGFSSIKLISATSAGLSFGKPGYELNLLYLGCLCALAMGGPGPIAFDTVMNKRRKRLNTQIHTQQPSEEGK